MLSFRKLLIIWMIIWLPLAGAAAAVMPLTGLSLKAAVPTISEASTNVGVDEFAMPCHAKSAGSERLFGQSCNHCELCHLANALAICEMPLMALPLTSPSFTAVRLLPHPSYVLILQARRLVRPSLKGEGIR